MDSAAPSWDSPTPSPLPQRPGPTLAPFTLTGYADIEFIEELGDPGEDMDSFVWKVRIDGGEPYYALKMVKSSHQEILTCSQGPGAKTDIRVNQFRFNSHHHLRRTVGSHLNRPLKTPQLYLDYFDPFNCECRVYGRLHEERREELAVRAHGYLLLTPEQEVEVAKRTMPNEFYDPDTDDDLFGRLLEPLARDRPVHASVKDLATDEIHFGPQHVDQLCRDLEDLHRLGILVRDITTSNYIGGKLIDFSRAWTMPHPSLERIDEKELWKQRYSDPCDLQDCIIDLGARDRWDEVDWPDELDACVRDKRENDGCGTDPRRYDWRKWEPDLEAVDAFMENDLYGPPFDEEEWIPEEECIR